jgi:dinuclear metal center YbgI/SA1388 family protein
MRRDELVSYLDDYLRVGGVDDSSNNGLQVEGAEDVSRVAFAVDAGLAAFEGAATARAQMLVVHHGLFWGEVLRVTGIHRHRLAFLLNAGLSLYAVHLPLDFHDEVGNNAMLCQRLDLGDVAFFGEYKGQPVGWAGWLPNQLSLHQFCTRVQEVLGEALVQVWDFGSESVQRVGVVSGSGASLVDEAAQVGVDVYLTGELSHSAYHRAKELGLNVVFAGHYATETVGLQALVSHLAAHFDLETIFLDLPTGA